MKPSNGRIVHYIMPDGRSIGSHRPAIVVHVWSPGAEPGEGSIQLQVFTDGTNDGEQYAGGIAWKTSVAYDESATKPGTWHWPEVVK